MDHLSADMRACIEACLKCHGMCLSMAMNHCLEAGGKHVAPGHFKLMMACAEMCQTSANFMLIGTPLHKHSCGLCAEICMQCAASCDEVGGMDSCMAQCRACAEHCQAMAA